MDTMGALALGTEQPSDTLLQRRPYKRTARLISKPMWRNIAFQSIFQVILLLWMLFKGAEWFGVPEGDFCAKWFNLSHDDTYTWDPATGQRSAVDNYRLNCQSFDDYCPDMDGDCYEADHLAADGVTSFRFSELRHFASTCMTCHDHTYVHTTLIFNAFVFCQICNEFNARSLFDDVYVLSGLSSNPIFGMVIVVTVVLQFLIVTFGGEFTRTSPLTAEQWGITIALGLIAFPVGNRYTDGHDE